MTPDFNDAELKIIDDTLKERYRAAKEIQHCDVELSLNADDLETAEYPSVYWEHNGCHFILSKVDNSNFFCQFFYDDKQQFKTGTKLYSDLYNCLMTTLQVQADYEREKNMKAEQS